MGGRWDKLSNPRRYLTLGFLLTGATLFSLGWVYLLYPGERVNLHAKDRVKMAEMVALMDAYRSSKGTLPPSLDIGVPADHAHYTYLVAKYGENYNYVGW